MSHYARLPSHSIINCQFKDVLFKLDFLDRISSFQWWPLQFFFFSLNMAFVWPQLMCASRDSSWPFLSAWQYPRSYQSMAGTWCLTTMTHSCVFECVSLLTLVVLAVILLLRGHSADSHRGAESLNSLALMTRRGQTLLDVQTMSLCTTTALFIQQVSSRPIYDAQRCVFHRL